MPKRFIFALVIFQALLTLLHWLFYITLLTFFPALAPYSLGLLVAILALSFSFLVFSIICQYYENIIFRFCYILSTVLLIFTLYSLMALALALAAAEVFNSSLEPLGFIALAVSTALTVYGLINARITRVTNLNVKLPNLPEAWKKRTAVMASDLHLGQVLRKGFAKKSVKKINSLQPDIVFIPGDFYDGVHTDFHALANEFKNLKAPLGSYFSSGNHEMFAGYGVCEQAIKDAGIIILENEKVEIDGLQIVGLSYRGDPVTYEGETDKNVQGRLEKINIDKNKPSILLKHVPNHIEAVEKMHINLQLSGHSHHGQIWPGRHITKRVWKGFDYGLKTLGNLQVYVSSGVGTWGPPLRVFTKSEIVKITFS